MNSFFRGFVCLCLFCAVCGAFLFIGPRFFPEWAYIPFKINPVALARGPLRLHWYGLMYAVAFLLVYGLVRYRLNREKWEIVPNQIDDFFTWGMAGVLAGGRLGYVLFYNLSYFLKHPWEAFIPLQADGHGWYFGLYGMSYHGGLIGVAAAFYLFSRKYKLNVWSMADLFVPVIPLGYAFGRIGNFINGELYGRVTSAPWAMIFPMDPLRQPRHPSQLYEAAFEGFFLFITLWTLRQIPQLRGKFFGLYLLGYGLVRFVLEYFREPDVQIGYLLAGLTLGQILCLIMIVAGAGFAFRRQIYV
ncbi:MAG: prolipoprotein diacylglyceryl transferase [Candidatus Omnitrophica bacterium]|nr:prolipoprotein diacylglyceryl transferase [Candidatus Omnitrophota bacterium]